MSQQHRRMLDMLAGWEQYARKCSESPDAQKNVSSAQYAKEADQVLALYQQVAALDDVPYEAARDTVVAALNIIAGEPDERFPPKRGAT